MFERAVTKSARRDGETEYRGLKAAYVEFAKPTLFIYARNYSVRGFVQMIWGVDISAWCSTLN